MDEKKSILHELYVFSEWKLEPEYIQKPDTIFPENISAFWKWFKFFGPKKSLIDSITAYKERQQKWHLSLGDEGKVIAILTDNILEIRTKRSEYATIAARTTVNRDGYSQWRKLVWSPDCSFVVLAYGNGIVSFFDLTASNLFNIPVECSRPGGLECTDNTHAVTDIIFMPLRVKDNKWSWEVAVVTYDGSVRGYLVSPTEGFTLHHRFSVSGGVSAVVHAPQHHTIYLASMPRTDVNEPSCALSAGLSAWRMLNEEPFYKLSVVSDQLEAQLAKQKLHLASYIPFFATNNLAFIVKISLSPDASKLVCLHCNGEVSVWRLPLLRLLYRHPLETQPHHHLDNPYRTLDPNLRDLMIFHPTDVAWWSNEEIILSRFNGAVTVCNIKDMENLLGDKPEFFQGVPQVSSSHDGSFVVLECESAVLPANKSRGDQNTEVVEVVEAEEGLYESVRELVKWMLYSITDLETFQPRPRSITVLRRVYRLLGLRSTTPQELFSRKIESGKYSEALALASRFHLDSDLVYQQQWRKNPVSTDAIAQYLSKVSRKIWAVHQCVDRLPETLPAANELLDFGLKLTNEEILKEINKERTEDAVNDVEEITLEHLNAYSSELLRCRHVMLFYRQRLRLYEAVLRGERSSYKKAMYERLRTRSVEASAVELAQERRLDALRALWPHLAGVRTRLKVLSAIPETTSPFDYKDLLPVPEEHERSEDPPPPEYDWCRKQIFRSIWNSNWSECSSPEAEPASLEEESRAVCEWYCARAREVEARSGLASHALALAALAPDSVQHRPLRQLLFHLLTLDTLLYDLNIDHVTLPMLEGFTNLQVCQLLVSKSTPESLVHDLKELVIPYLKRYEKLTNCADACLSGLTELLESMSTDDLSAILVVLQSPTEFRLDVLAHLQLVERCLFAYGGTEQLDKACDLLDTILRETDGSISASSLMRRVRALERVVGACTRLAWRGVRVPLAELRRLAAEPPHARALLTRLARHHSARDGKCTPQEWDKLLTDLLELQSTLFTCVSKEECYEIYASSLLTSGEASSIRLAGDALTCDLLAREASTRRASLVSYSTSLKLVLGAATEYFNSASSLTDPALNLARCCLTLIKDKTPEIEEELDLISSLEILNSFGLTILPIQVRLCEEKLTLIEECLKSDANAFLASHKLLKLAKLLRVGHDEQSREGAVLQLVCARAVDAGGAGGGAAATAARRLAALRHAPAASLLAHVARHAHAHADRAARSQLYAAAAAHASPHLLPDILRDRLALELEDLQQTGAALKEHAHFDRRWPSTDDEFSDAITTPVIEKKDLAAPCEREQPMPFFDRLLESIESAHEEDASESGACPTTCLEWYRTLYAEHRVVGDAYAGFATPRASPAADTALHWYYVHNVLHEGAAHLEGEVCARCAAWLVRRETPRGVAGAVRAPLERLLRGRRSPLPAAAALYSLLLRCNAPELRDDVYLTRPLALARRTMRLRNASQEQLDTIARCVAALSGVAEVAELRRRGVPLDAPLFHSDADYRREVIYRLARSPEKEDLVRACAMADKYGVDAVEAWLQHAHTDVTLHHLTRDTLPRLDAPTYERVKEALWERVEGTAHQALLNYFALLRSLDEKAVVLGVSAEVHAKLVSKTKAASNELDYKLLWQERDPDVWTRHAVTAMRANNAAAVGKLVRALATHTRLPATANRLYAEWLTRYFFDVTPSQESSKKWMQQYRQCASYFNKLHAEDLLQFIKNVCFSDEAVQRVAGSTRGLMITQASEYCLHDHASPQSPRLADSDAKEGSWSVAGQVLERWAHFLEGFHSKDSQELMTSMDVAETPGVWSELEKSRGESKAAVACLARVVMVTEDAARALPALVWLLRLDVAPHLVFDHITLHCVHDVSEMETLVSRVVQSEAGGVEFPEESVALMSRAGLALGLSARAQVALLALWPAADERAGAQCTLRLLAAEWPELRSLPEAELLSDAGRCHLFARLCADALADGAWRRRKALVDTLNCWPTTLNSSGRSLQCELIGSLLNQSRDHKESLLLIRLLLKRPALSEQEIKWLTENVDSDAVVNAIWVILLSKSEHSKRDIPKLAIQHKETILNEDIEEDLIKELLDSELFIKLVATPLYAPIVNYIMTPKGQSQYSVEWAVERLMAANCLPEAAHLRLLARGVPAALRDFSTTLKLSIAKGIFKQ